MLSVVAEVLSHGAAGVGGQVLEGSGVGGGGGDDDAIERGKRFVIKLLWC